MCGRLVRGFCIVAESECCVFPPEQYIKHRLLGGRCGPRPRLCGKTWFCLPRSHACQMRLAPWLLVASAFLLCASRAEEEVESSASGAKFNKDELEAILKKEHSDRVSNIFDSENGIQPRCL